MSKPAIRVALKEFRLHINYATLSCLENPPYLHFRYNEKKNLLAVSGSNEETANSFEVPKRAAHGECYISRMALTESLRRRMGWNENESYRITGEFLPDMGVVLFDLSDATIVTQSVSE